MRRKNDHSGAGLRCHIYCGSLIEECIIFAAALINPPAVAV